MDMWSAAATGSGANVEPSLISTATPVCDDFRNKSLHPSHFQKNIRMSVETSRQERTTLPLAAVRVTVVMTTSRCRTYSRARCTIAFVGAHRQKQTSGSRSSAFCHNTDSDVTDSDWRTHKTKENHQSSLGIVQ
jgi:hypothetical protein